MTRLFMLMLSLAAPSLAGIGVVIVLAMGLYDLKPILVSAGLGAVLGVPVAWLIARRLQENG